MCRDMADAGSMPPMSNMEAYGAEIAARMKKKLAELKDSGITSGVHFFI